MILILVPILLGVLVLFVLWRVSLSKIVAAMKESGSSTFEAYFIIIIVVGGIATALYMIIEII